MTPVYVVHVEGPDWEHWSDVHPTQGSAERWVERCSYTAGAVARIYRLGHEDFRGNDPGPQMRLVRTIR